MAPPHEPDLQSVPSQNFPEKAPQVNNAARNSFVFPKSCCVGSGGPLNSVHKNRANQEQHEKNNSGCGHVLVADEMTTCGICLENTVRCDGNMDESFCCNGTVSHYFHANEDCFLAYARLAFEHDGEYCTTVKQGQTSSEKKALISNPRELPCPFFQSGDCDCACIPEETLIRVLTQNHDILQSFFKAKSRSLEQEEELQQQEEEQERAAKARKKSSMNRLLETIDEVLARASSVPCPQCGLRIQKKCHCVHMTCADCKHGFCYCCGQRLSSCGGCNNYIENNPGWDRFAIADSGESKSAGALHEFHRRRMAYFLNQVKKSLPPKLWAELRRREPNKFRNVPTPGRLITWWEIDHAIKPPVFGNTRDCDLAWRWEGRDIARANNMHNLCMWPSFTPFCSCW